MEAQPEIPEFYRGRSILITGCTGFIGKSLIWKLLYSCPSIKTIYVLIRKRHGKNVSERKEELFNCMIYDNFRDSNKDILEKIVAIEGDVSEENLGISDEDKMIILNEVSIVFHNAAILKMDATLNQAINVNTKGVIRILNIALEMKKLEALIHVSTAYCCCNENLVEEKLYSIPGNPHDIIRSVDGLPPHILEQITEDIISPLPNTYTYSKRLTELVLQTYDDKLPIIIARPTIVFSSMQDPFPGWMDNLNGAAGVAVGAGKGILHSFYGNLKSKGDLVPVDIVCNSLIAMPWAEIDKKKSDLTKSKISVYNIALTECDQITWGDYQEVCKKATTIYPYETILWYPTYDVIQENEFLHKLEKIFYHLIPAYVIDYILHLLGRKTFLVKVQKKISQGLKLLSYFSRQQWTFQTDNIMMLKNMMNEADKKVFPVTEKGLDFELLLKQSASVSKQYYFKENMDNIEWCRTKLKIFLAVKIIAKLFIYYIFLKVVWKIFYSFYHIFTS